MPPWAQATFPGYKTLNRIQSRIFKTAFHSNQNLLVCAPTGAWAVGGRGPRQPEPAGVRTHHRSGEGEAEGEGGGQNSLILQSQLAPLGGL